MQKLFLCIMSVVIGVSLDVMAEVQKCCAPGTVALCGEDCCPRACSSYNSGGKTIKKCCPEGETTYGTAGNCCKTGKISGSGATAQCCGDEETPSTGSNNKCCKDSEEIECTDKTWDSDECKCNCTIEGREYYNQSTGKYECCPQNLVNGHCCSSTEGEDTAGEGCEDCCPTSKPKLLYS